MNKFDECDIDCDQYTSTFTYLEFVKKKNLVCLTNYRLI